LKWFVSYFDMRKVKVKHEDTYSTTRVLKKGTPQGSSLSRLIFSLYVNDLPRVLQKCQSLLYADDLVLFYSGTSAEEINEALQSDLDNLQKWCENNAMTINLNKTCAMVFKPPRNSIDGDVEVHINNKHINVVAEFKYLGFHLDSKLTFDNHFSIVCKEITKRTYMINRYKFNFNEKWLKIFSTSIVLSVLEYGLPVWGKRSKVEYDRLDKIMFKLAALVIFKRRICSTEKLNLFEKLNWLSSEERYKVYTLHFVYKHVICHTNLSNVFSNKFVKRPKVERQSRCSNNLLVPRLRTEFGKAGLFYQAIIMWNNLTEDIKTCSSFVKFDLKLRDFILITRTSDFI